MLLTKIILITSTICLLLCVTTNNILFRNFFPFYHLFFSAAPDVTVSSSCGDVANEGQSCQLTCMPSAGNIADYVFEWTFQYKFGGSYEVLPAATPGELVLSTVGYLDVGTYRCSASGEVDDLYLEINCKYFSPANSFT